MQYVAKDAEFNGAEVELTFHLVREAKRTLDLDLGADTLRATNKSTRENLPRIPARQYSAKLAYGHQDVLVALEGPNGGPKPHRARRAAHVGLHPGECERHLAMARWRADVGAVSPRHESDQCGGARTRVLPQGVRATAWPRPRRRSTTPLLAPANEVCVHAGSAPSRPTRKANVSLSKAPHGQNLLAAVPDGA